MAHYEERMGRLFFMSDEGVTYELTRPSVIFSKENYEVHRIGSRDILEEYYKSAVEQLKEINSSLYEQWVIMDLPKSADIVNRVMHVKGYMRSFLEEIDNVVGE